VGAAHGRFRVFLFATPADAGGFGWGEGSSDGAGSGAASRARQAGRTGGHRVLGVDGEGLTLLPTPQTSDTNGPGEHGTGGPDLRTAVSLLPAPRATRGGSSTETSKLLPTPRATNNENRQSDGYGGKDGNYHGLVNGMSSWGQYAAAIARAEQAIGRPAPPPTEIGPKGTPRLSPRFVEWLMMLPDGWVTDVAGLTRNEQLKMLGNGVVPAQCAEALRAFLRDAYGIEAAA